MNTLALQSFVNTFEKVSSTGLPVAPEGAGGAGALVGGLLGGAGVLIGGALLGGRRVARAGTRKRGRAWQASDDLLTKPERSAGIPKSDISSVTGSETKLLETQVKTPKAAPSTSKSKDRGSPWEQGWPPPMRAPTPTPTPRPSQPETVELLLKLQRVMQRQQEILGHF
jgi:hypothetical protein